jgi:hypothetical protein
MTDVTFRNEMHRLFGAHAKTASRAILDAVWMRVQDKPDEFMIWAVKRLCDEEKLPQNLGRYFEIVLYADWRGSKGYRREALPGCHECQNGFIRAWRQDGDRVLLRCLCNQDSLYDFMRPVTSAQALRDGFILCPPGKREAQFEAERFGYGRIGPKTDAGKMAAGLARNPVPVEEIYDFDDAVPF